MVAHSFFVVLYLSFARNIKNIIFASATNIYVITC